ncbi:hypothetical protein BZB76_2747 [Actinomadura pelletieri DSM 43383]|uniref:Uncharacterized protein n=1 Tax=Actinomadura pelletieri DSM 43383 TaxID=1120940 RepID=A0A495QMN3_9ACTN|nr:hypothetical protein [Actinomadura pelletieri]RKS74238.1 hypothetical protein BZB76_2747 [Actinomadura pelletieri DSM 43383]
MATITFPVPSTTTSRFAVAAESVPQDLPGLLHRHPTGPFHAHITGRLGSPQLQVAREDLSSLCWDPGQIRAVRLEDRHAARAFNDATEFAVVTAFAPITDQPRGVQVARSAAHTIAEATGGIMADLVTGHVLTPSAPERTRFVLGDHWLGDVLPPSRANGHCTAPDPEMDPEGVNGCACVRLQTRGLRRFGLPELQISEVACPHDLAALNVLRTTARRLLTDHWSWLATGPAARTRTIAADLRLARGDFNDFWGSTRRTPPTPPTAFHVTLSPRTPRLLTVAPPADFDGTINDWLWDDTLPLGMYDVLQAHPDPLPTAA